MNKGFTKVVNSFKQTGAGLQHATLMLRRFFMIYFNIMLITLSLFGILFLHQELVTLRNQIANTLQNIAQENKIQHQDTLHEINKNLTILLSANGAIEPHKNIISDQVLEQAKLYQQLKLTYEALSNLQNPDVLFAKLHKLQKISDEKFALIIKDILAIDVKNILSKDYLLQEISKLEQSLEPKNNELTWWQKKLSYHLRISPVATHNLLQKEKELLTLAYAALKNDALTIAVQALHQVNSPSKELLKVIHSLEMRLKIQYDLENIIGELINHD